MDKALALASSLMDLQAQLRNAGLWQEGRPSEQALASTQPFCVDTLSFPQWLQFIFIERLASLLEQRQALPTACQVAPMAEEYFKKGDAGSEVLRTLQAIDELLSQG